MKITWTGVVQALVTIVVFPTIWLPGAIIGFVVAAFLSGFRWGMERIE